MAWVALGFRRGGQLFTIDADTLIMSCVAASVLMKRARADEVHDKYIIAITKPAGVRGASRLLQGRSNE